MQAARNKEENEARQRILDVATQLFSEHGLEGTSTRDIAKQSGLNISLISYYFGGKEGLYTTIISEFAKGAETRLHEILAGFEPEKITRASFQSQMKAIIEAIVYYKVATPHMQTILQREMLAGFPFARETFESTFSHLGELVVSIFTVAQKKKIVNSDINPFVWFLSLVHSVDSFLMSTPCKTKFSAHCPQIPGEEGLLINQLCQIFVDGVCHK